MTIDNTTMDVIVSTVTAVVQEPTISTITATIKGNVVQIPFDVISQVKDFYEGSWSKLMWFVGVIGTIGLIILGYIVPKEQNKKFDKLLLKQKEKFEFLLQKQNEEFNKQIEEQNQEFKNRIIKIQNKICETTSGLFQNSAVLAKAVINKDIEVIFGLWCSSIEEFIGMDEESFYTQKEQKIFEVLVKALKEILNIQENKNIIDKNRLKGIVNILKKIDKEKISANLEDDINNIIEFYNKFNNVNEKL